MSAILDRRTRAHWHELTEGEKRQAVRKFAATWPPCTIAAACGLSIEAVRVILAEREHRA
ncbi:MAG: hypothetical protein WD078_14355 [Woeseia sp.]